MKTKEIGVYAQVESMRNLGDFNEVSEIAYLNPINLEWEIPELVMQKKAKATTYLHTIPFSSVIFLVFKKYFINFLIDFNIKHFNHWPLKVHHKNQVLTDYELFHLSYPTDVKNIIKYKQSDFVVLPRRGWDENTITKPVEILDYESYISLKEVLNESNENLTIRYTKLILDFSNETDDLIRFIDVPFNIGYYVSERLKDAIEKERFTGMRFQEIEEMDKRIKG